MASTRTTNYVNWQAKGSRRTIASFEEYIKTEQTKIIIAFMKLAYRIAKMAS